jgi:nicotinamide mononucleotide transporter
MIMFGGILLLKGKKKIADEGKTKFFIELAISIGLSIAMAGAGFILMIVFAMNGYLDAAATMLSVVATWWLVRSYIQHWWLWIVADALTTALCLSQGMWWMAALYGAYTASAVIGFVHWKRNGVYLNI